MLSKLIVLSFVHLLFHAFCSLSVLSHTLGADQFTAHITLQELDEICETMISAIKWRLANNEELTRKIVKDISGALAYSRSTSLRISEPSKE
jgi:hypothetical protein